MNIFHIWEPIKPLTEEEKKLFSNWGTAQNKWVEDSSHWRASSTDRFKKILQMVNRKNTIHSGKIESLYSFSSDDAIDRGITETLVRGEYDEREAFSNLADDERENIKRLIREDSPLISVFQSILERGLFSVTAIKEIHLAVMVGIKTYPATDTLGNPVNALLTPGEWKKLPNTVTRQDGQIHQYCPPEQVQSEVEMLVNLANQYDLLVQEHKMNPVLLVSFVHHRFTQIHPFSDGNGRTARALMNFFLFKYDLLPIPILKDSREAYYRTLEEADAGDLVTFTNFLYKQERIQIEEFYEFWSENEEILTRDDDILIEEIGKQILHAKEQKQDLEYQTLNKITDTLIDAAYSWLDEKGNAFTQIAQIPSPKIHRSTSDEYYWYKKSIIDSVNYLSSSYFVKDSKYNRFLSISFLIEEVQFLFVLSFHDIGQQRLTKGVTMFSQVKNTRDRMPVDTRFYMKEPFLFSEEDSNLEEDFMRFLTRFFKEALIDFSKHIKSL